MTTTFTVLAIFLVAIAIAMTVVLAMIADYLHNTMNSLKKSVDEQSDIHAAILVELGLIRKELHQVNKIALLQHAIDDWDKNKWRKILEEYSSLYFIEKYFSEHKETETPNN